MYKVIYNGFIIDVIENIKYVRYIVKTGKVTLTDKSSAHGIYGSDMKTVYMLREKCPREAVQYKSVTIHEINECEYNNLKEKLHRDIKVVSDVPTLENARSKKIVEMSNECKQAIINGVSVLLSDNLYHHFRLTVEDQINLYDLKSQVDAGKDYVVYHETDAVCKKFSAKDFAKLYDKVNEHRRFHTTYFNVLKYCINNTYDIDKIEDITYGMSLEKFTLPEDIKALLEVK